MPHASTIAAVAVRTQAMVLISAERTGRRIVKTTRPLDVEFGIDPEQQSDNERQPKAR